MLDKEEEPEKRGFKAIDFVLVLLAILGIMNTLMIDRAKIPDWYFYSSIGLMIIATVVFFVSHLGTSWDDRINAWREKKRRNGIAKRYIPEFRNLVNNSYEFNSSISSIYTILKSHYKGLVGGSFASFVDNTMKSHDETKIQNSLREIETELDESNKTFRDLFLIMKQFEFILYIYNRNLKVIEYYVHEITEDRERKIAKNIENHFEEFREKYNLFLSDFKKFCHNVNEEVGKIALPEYSFRHIKKW